MFEIYRHLHHQLVFFILFISILPMIDWRLFRKERLRTHILPI